jgi:hypothetical protein
LQMKVDHENYGYIKARGFLIWLLLLTRCFKTPILIGVWLGEDQRTSSIMTRI